jgi:hypothetical protein
LEKKIKKTTQDEIQAKTKQGVFSFFKPVVDNSITRGVGHGVNTIGQGVNTIGQTVGLVH